MSRTSSIGWTIELPLTEEEVDVTIEYSYSPGYPGCGPSFSSPGEPAESSEIDYTRITRIDTGEVLQFDPYADLPPQRLWNLHEAIDDQESERSYCDPDDWRDY